MNNVLFVNEVEFLLAQEMRFYFMVAANNCFDLLTDQLHLRAHKIWDRDSDFAYIQDAVINNRELVIET